MKKKDETPKITQIFLEHVLATRAGVSALKKDLAAAEARLSGFEGELMRALDQGIPVAPGLLGAGINIEERRTPAYKAWLEKLAGPEAVARAIRETVPTQIRRVVILRGREIIK